MHKNKGIISNVSKTLYRHRGYLKALKILIKIINKREEVADRNIIEAQKELAKMHKNSIEASILADALSVLLSRPKFMRKLGFEESFLHNAHYLTVQIAKSNFWGTEMLSHLNCCEEKSPRQLQPF